MTNNQLYDLGYADGYHGVSLNTTHFLEDYYQMGVADGRADKENGVETVGVKSAFIGDNFEEDNDPPAGYRWLGEQRTPEKGEIYLTKAGNAGVAKTEAKNGRQRHMLEPIQKCSGDWRHSCGFAAGHSGRCSGALVK